MRNNQNLDFMPDILEDIVSNLNLKYPNCSLNSIINITLAKTAQMLTAIRIKYKEFSNTGFPNYYAISFMPSGFGKDRISNDLDNYIFKDFRLWFEDKAKEYRRLKCKQIEECINKKYSGIKNEIKKAGLISTEQDKLRNLVIEIKNGTQEGFYSDAKAFKEAAFGSLFVKISELGLYLKNSKIEEKQFISRLFDAYDAKTESKCIKGDVRSTDVENVPTNVLLYSDSTLFAKELKPVFQSLMLTGMSRRAIVTFVENCRLKIEVDPHKAYQIEANFFSCAENISNQLFRIFLNIKSNSNYVLLEETFNEVFYPYKVLLVNKANEESNPLIRIEILSRELKALKLSCLYASLNHTKKLVIDKVDMSQAIKTIEQLSTDLPRFINQKPQYNDKYDKLYEFFLYNIEKEFSKTELTHKYFKHFGFSRKTFLIEFDEAIEIIKDMAECNGYYLKKTQFNNNSGKKYSLVKIESQLLSPQVKELSKML